MRVTIKDSVPAYASQAVFANTINVEYTVFGEIARTVNITLNVSKGSHCSGLGKE